VADAIAVSWSDAVAVVELCRPPTNYFDDILLRELADACDALQADPSCHAVVLGARGKHFCAGADFGSDALQQDRVEAARRIYEQGARLFDLELPIIAAVNGAAVGGGLGLACAADFRVASSDSRLRANFSLLGFHQGFGLSVTLPRIVGEQKALDLLVTSRRVFGEEAEAIGLVDRLAPPGCELSGAVQLATEIAAMGPSAVRAIKQTMTAGRRDQISAAFAHELREQQRLWDTPDSQARMQDALSPRPHVRPGGPAQRKDNLR
jgi:2-(1,2-epoxy-1,2-dihydrophenyl)acetyl-CoA isomerase